MLRRIIKEEIFLLEDNEKIGDITIYNGVYRRLLFDNELISWQCTDGGYTVYTHKPPNPHWITKHELLEKLYNKRVTAENRDTQIDEILL